jgi:hypothetical protein
MCPNRMSCLVSFRPSTHILSFHLAGIVPDAHPHTEKLQRSSIHLQCLSVGPWHVQRERERSSIRTRPDPPKGSPLTQGASSISKYIYIYMYIFMHIRAGSKVGRSSSTRRLPERSLHSRKWTLLQSEKVNLLQHRIKILPV